MKKLNGKVTDELDFFGNVDVFELQKEYGTPLYVYNERILRERCNTLKNLVPYENFKVNYSAKANSNLTFLKIVRDCGLLVDAMSPGEITVELKAGFKPEDIFFISNNVTEEEMQFAIDKGITISCDSLSQLEQYGQLNPNSKVAIRFNPGVGAGHSEKVVTGGKKTKFGVSVEFIPQVKEILAKYNLTLCGINQHIGSLFMEGTPYVESFHAIEEIASHFDTLEFVDLGGGFGIPYHKETDEAPIELKDFSTKINDFMENFAKKYGKKVTFKIEPGRFISAECSVLLGTITGVKQNDANTFVGSDIGFNVLQRPVMYDSYHGVEVYTKRDVKEVEFKKVSVVGNICESGDILAKDRNLPVMEKGDMIGVLDAGAYGHVMSSNYNNRLRPAEVLIRENGEVVLIRKRDTIEQLLQNYTDVEI